MGSSRRRKPTSPSAASAGAGILRATRVPIPPKPSATPTANAKVVPTEGASTTNARAWSAPRPG